MRYEIKGGNFPVLVCNLEENETMITDVVSMSLITPNKQIQTTSKGGLGKVLGRMF